MARLKWFFIGRDGRLRSGWAILIYILVSVVLSLLLYGLLRLAGVPKREPGDFAIWEGSWRLLLALAATWVGCLAVRQRFSRPFLADSRAGLHFGIGAGAGVVMISLAVLIPLAAGQLRLMPTDDPAGAVATSILVQLIVLVPGSIAEEVVLRGFIFQQLVRMVRPWGAVAITAALFGAGHLGNPNATIAGTLNIVLVGVLFGVITLRSGSLWLASGLHVAWNIFQGPFWGQPISGQKFGLSLLENTYVGAEGWTGGDFGPEASFVAAAILAVACGIAFLVPRQWYRPYEAAPDPLPVVPPAPEPPAVA